MNGIEAGMTGRELLDPDVLDNPYPFYAGLLQQPVWRVPGTDIFLVSSFELLSEAADRTDDFSSQTSYLL